MTRATTVAAAIGLGILALMWPIAPAFAQDTSGLGLEVERLRAELKDLQRYVYGGGELPPPSSGATGGVDPRAADFELRLTALEEQIRALRGSLEQTDYRLQGIETRLDALVADVDGRLAALERGQPGATTSGLALPDSTASQTLGDAGTSTTSTATTLTLTPPPEPASSTTQAAPTTLAALPPGTVMDQYNYAFGLLRKADYDQAERSLTAFVETYPEDPLSGNAYYWLGQIYSLRGDHERAAVTYLKGYRQYPDGKYAPHSLLKLGVSLGRLDKKVEACASFAELATKFPNAEAAVTSEAAAESGALGCG